MAGERAGRGGGSIVAALRSFWLQNSLASPSHAPRAGSLRRGCHGTNGTRLCLQFFHLPQGAVAIEVGGLALGSTGG